MTNVPANIRTLAALYLIVGAIELALSILAVLAIGYIGLVWSADPGHTGSLLTTPAVPLLLAGLVAYPLPSIVSGYGLLRNERWSPPWAWSATALHLINFPIGTALGIYGAIVLGRDS